MVGTLQQGKDDVRAGADADKTLYQVKQGQLHGPELRRRSRTSTEAEIKLKELVQDSAGDWAERQQRSAAAGGSRQRGAKSDEHAPHRQRIGRLGAALAALVLALAAPRRLGRRRAKNAIESIDCLAGAGRQDRRQASTLKEPLGDAAAGLRGHQPAAHRARLPGHRQRRSAATQHRGRRGRRCAACQRRPGRRTARAWCSTSTPQTSRHAASTATPLLVTLDDAGAGAAAQLRPRRQRASAFAEAPPATTAARAARRRLPPRHATAKAASSSTCPTANIGIDIRQQGRQLVVDFLQHRRCRATSCAASTWPTSARRCASSTPSSRAATRAW